jgi:hypothetical protein
LGDRLCRPPQSSQTSALPWSIPQHSVNLIDMIRLSTSHLASDCSRKAPQPTPAAGIINMVGVHPPNSLPVSAGRILAGEHP